MSWALGLCTAEGQEQNDKMNVNFLMGLPSINTPVNTKCFLCPEFEAQNPYGPLEDSKHTKPEVR